MASTLLTVGNAKVRKGETRGYRTHILHLAPSWLSGHNTCPMATAGCAAACLNTAGRGGIAKQDTETHTARNGVTVKLNTIQKARIRKTRELFADRYAFLARLVAEIDRAIRKAERDGMVPVFRLNGTSDIRWEVMPVTRDGVEYPNVFAAFPTVQFYDYTKIPNRRVAHIPNYHLTFSLADGNDVHAAEALRHGLNVAAVFRSLPTEYLGRRVINGDETDLRFTDPQGVVVGLKAKGRAKRDVTGFVRN